MSCRTQALGGVVDDDVVPCVTTCVVARTPQATAKFVIGCVAATVVNPAYLADSEASNAFVAVTAERHCVWPDTKDAVVAQAPRKWLAQRRLYFDGAIVYVVRRTSEAMVAMSVVELLGGVVVTVDSAAVTHHIVDDVAAPVQVRPGLVLLRPSWIVHAVMRGDVMPLYSAPAVN